MFFKALTLAAAALSTVSAQRPSNMSICDYYTTGLLTNNTAENQLTVLTLIVNTAVIGNYTPKLNKGVLVPGILTPGEYNGTAVDLAPYFDGGLASTNTGGSAGMSVNFLDGGGAAPLMNNTAADNMSSMQYTLLTHLYEYFGTLLGCTLQSPNSAFSPYTGDASMYEVHKYMALSPAEIGYFIQQVALSASSFGVAASDLAIVGTALTSLFDYRCSPPTTVIMSQGPQLNAICIDSTCPLAVNATCDKYNGTVAEPSTAISSLVPTTTAKVTGTATPMASATGSMSMTGTATSASASASANVAAGMGCGMGVAAVAAVAGGFAALLL